ncbi:TlpA family protein disulfide reductase [Pararhodonellum marinum]|uniref:TlpA family protein disulfide reductase n=1 Tax=Pararhodonellum marinum TaxID=2755358 RepID=UPI00188FF530|nr:TlpA disulfide reductase family protein [Pararhodonellum marinum]
MKSNVLLIFVCFFVTNSYTKDELRIVDFDELEGEFKTPSDKIRIYNFWATWCAPCIKEMPHFEKVNAEDPELDLYFISMDDGRKPERVTGFIEKRSIKSPVILLDDVDFDRWIDKVDPSWSGAIPATLFILPDGSKSFHEGEMDESELLEKINQLKTKLR